MPPVRAANGGDAGRVPRSGKPAVDRCADAPALDRRFARPMMAGNEQDDTVAGVNRLIENAVDRAPRIVECHPVQIEHPIGLGRARAKPPVPARVERIPPRNGEGNRPRSGRWRGPTVEAARWWAPAISLRLVPLPVPGMIFFFLSSFRFDLLMR
jgi:hypothetical protein